MRIRALETEQWLPQPIEAVFAFFGDVNNLQELTPPWLHFRIISTDLREIHQGMKIEYRIRWRWVPLRWRTEITAWEPPFRFIDEQIKGPYKLWRHEHTFEEKDGGTLIRDRVDYAIPGWILEPFMHRWIVRPDLDRIFEYRKERMGQLLTKPAEIQQHA